MITLPWPPSVNSYWRTFRGRMIISKEGREYRKAVAELIQGNWRYTKSVKVTITAYRPDNRKRDLDNLFKAALDSLTYAGIWEDDSQIVDLRIVWGDIIAGMLKVEIESVDDPRTAASSRVSKEDDSQGSKAKDASN